MTKLFPNLGKPTINSIEISIQILGGIERGWSVLAALIVSLLFQRQVSHSATKMRMLCFIPSQKEECLTDLEVLVKSECPR